VPEGAYVALEERPNIVRGNIAIEYFDPTKIRSSILDKISKGDVIVVCYNAFYTEPRMQGQFWGNLFSEVLNWKKAGCFNHPLCIDYDEFNEIISSRFHSVYGGQLRVGAWIYLNVGKFRSLKTRLMMSCWTLKEIYMLIIGHFSYVFLKSVQDREFLGGYSRYFNTVRDLPREECLVLMKCKDGKTRWKTNFRIKPAVRVPETADGTLFNHGLAVLQAKQAPTIDADKQHLITVLRNVKQQFNLKDKELAKLTEVSPSMITKIFKKEPETQNQEPEIPDAESEAK